MILTIPLTGTVLLEGEVHGKGNLVGDPDDPIRPIDLDLGNVSWRMVDIDLDNEVMVIEVEAGEKVSEPTGATSDEDVSIHITRLATKKEKAGFLKYARELINNRTKDELYTLANCPKLKRPFKEV